LTERCEVLPQASDFAAHGAFLVRTLQDLVGVSHDLRHLREEFLVAGTERARVLLEPGLEKLHVERP